MHVEPLYGRLLSIPYFAVLCIPIDSTGDPREFFIQTVRDHFLELQVNYGFGLQTTGKNYI